LGEFLRYGDLFLGEGVTVFFLLRIGVIFLFGGTRRILPFALWRGGPQIGPLEGRPSPDVWFIDLPFLCSLHYLGE